MELFFMSLSLQAFSNQWIKNVKSVHPCMCVPMGIYVCVCGGSGGVPANGTPCGEKKEPLLQVGSILINDPFF